MIFLDNIDTHINESKNRPVSSHTFFGNSIGIEFFSEAENDEFFTDIRLKQIVHDLQSTTNTLNLTFLDDDFSFKFIRGSYYDTSKFTKTFFIKIFGLKGMAIPEGEILKIIYDKLDLKANDTYINTPPIINADAFLITRRSYKEDFNDKNLIVEI